MIIGKAITFGDNIDTDQIIGAHHLVLPDIKAMAPFAFEHHEQFTTGFSRGDIIIAGENFGCGSSREQAPAVLKERGVAAIVARSFARIFYRNGINIGLRLVVCPQGVDAFNGDNFELGSDSLRNTTDGRHYEVEPLPPFIQTVLKCGGIVEYIRRNG